MDEIFNYKMRLMIDKKIRENEIEWEKTIIFNSWNEFDKSLISFSKIKIKLMKFNQIILKTENKDIYFSFWIVLISFHVL